MNNITNNFSLKNSNTSLSIVDNTFKIKNNNDSIFEVTNNNIKFNGHEQNTSGGIVVLDENGKISGSLYDIPKESDPIFTANSGQFIQLSSANVLGNEFSLSGNLNLSGNLTFNGNKENTSGGIVVLNENGKISGSLYDISDLSVYAPLSGAEFTGNIKIGNDKKYSKIQQNQLILFTNDNINQVEGTISVSLNGILNDLNFKQISYFDINIETDNSDIESHIRFNGHDQNTSGGFVIVDNNGFIPSSIYYVPTKYSDLEPDIIYLTEHQSLNDYATTGWVEGKEYATTGWVEGKGYLTKHQSLNDYATTGWVEGKGYLTEHQSLSEYLLSSIYASQSGQFILLSSANTLGDNFSLNGDLKLNGHSLNISGGLVKVETNGKILSSLIPDNFITDEELETRISQIPTNGGSGPESDPIFAANSGQFVQLSAANTLGDNFSLNGDLKLNGYSLNSPSGLVVLDENGNIKIGNDIQNSQIQPNKIFSQLSGSSCSISGSTSINYSYSLIPPFNVLSGYISVNFGSNNKRNYFYDENEKIFKCEDDNGQTLFEFVEVNGTSGILFGTNDSTVAEGYFTKIDLSDLTWVNGGENPELFEYKLYDIPSAVSYFDINLSSSLQNLESHIRFNGHDQNTSGGIVVLDKNGKIPSSSYDIPNIPVGANNINLNDYLPLSTYTEQSGLFLQNEKTISITKIPSDEVLFLELEYSNDPTFTQNTIISSTYKIAENDSRFKVFDGNNYINVPTSGLGPEFNGCSINVQIDDLSPSSITYIRYRWIYETISDAFFKSWSMGYISYGEEIFLSYNEQSKCYGSSKNDTHFRIIKIGHNLKIKFYYRGLDEYSVPILIDEGTALNYDLVNIIWKNRK